MNTTPLLSDNTLTCVPTACHAREVCIFFADYAAWLLGCGATCIRLQQNVDRMASALGYEVVMTVLPKHINVAVRLSDCSEYFSYLVSTRVTAINFDINTRLSELSWAIHDGKINFADARSEMERIVTTPRAPINLVLLLASLANGAFCRLFGGDLVAVATVIVATMAGLFLKNIMVERKVDIRLVIVLCAFVSSVLASADSLFAIGGTPQIAVATSVLYLVPGIPFINSFSDMLTGNYIVAFCRFTHATILTCCLSLGLCGGLLLMNLGMF